MDSKVTFRVRLAANICDGYVDIKMRRSRIEGIHLVIELPMIITNWRRFVDDFTETVTHELLHIITWSECPDPKRNEMLVKSLMGGIENE